MKGKAIEIAFTDLFVEGLCSRARNSCTNLKDNGRAGDEQDHLILILTAVR